MVGQARPTEAIDERFVYTGERRQYVAFPARRHRDGQRFAHRRGRLVDWSIRNRPAIHQFNGYSHFAIKAERDGELLDARVLNGPYEGDPTGSPSTRKFDGYGFGANRDSMAGVPHFDDVTFVGRFPDRRARIPARRIPGEGADDRVQPVHSAQRPRFFDAGGACSPSTSRTTPRRRSTTRIAATLGNYGCDSGVHAFLDGRRL